MKRKQIENLLATISSHLNAASPEENKRLDALQKSLAQILLTQDTPLKEIQPNILASQNFPAVDFDKGRLEKLVSEAQPTAAENSLQVALRTSDFQTQLFQSARQTGYLKTVIPPFAGIKKTKTEGPFSGAGGIDLSFDYFPILTKLNSVYIEGQALPALLFKTRTFRFPIEIPTSPLTFHKKEESPSEGSEFPLSERKFKIPKNISGSRIGDTRFSEKITIKNPKDFADYFPKTTRLYQLAGNTIWVRANLFSTAAPDGHYCGLRISNGTVFLDALPIHEENAKITVSNTTTITVNVNLAQKEPSANTDGMFGQDAKDAFYKLPETFSFNLKNGQKTILSVGHIDCTVFGEPYSLNYENSQNTGYNELISSVTIPVKNDKSEFSITASKSELIDINGNAQIQNNYWTLFSNEIDIQKPLEADGNGGLLFECSKGISTNIKKTEEILSLSEPSIFLSPGSIYLIDQKSNGEGLQHQLNLWKDNSKPFGTSLDIKYRKESILVFTSESKAEENFGLLADLNFKIDRPVKVNGEPVAISTKQSLVFINGKLETRSIQILDFDILKDNSLPPISNQPIPEFLEPLAFALKNALLTVTPVMALSLIGNLDPDFKTILEAKLTTLYGVFNYLPTLPDPYAANIGFLRRQDPREKENLFRMENIILQLVNLTSWKENEEISTEFEFRKINSNQNIQNPTYYSSQTWGETPPAEPQFNNIFNSTADDGGGILLDKTYSISNIRNSDRSNDTIRKVEEILGNLANTDRFTLLDVSSKANQMGVSFKQFQRRIRQKEEGALENLWEFPLKIDKLDVISQGINAQAFMLPQISWEPTFNLSEQVVTDGSTMANDPPQGFNYYPDDGIPTYIGNFGEDPVALAPIPMSKFLVNVYKSQRDQTTYALFNLPFGMVALTLLDNQSNQTKKPKITNISPEFNDSIRGAIQLELTAGSSFAAEGDLFQGLTIQLSNVQDMAGNQDDYSTLGSSVHEIFSREFSLAPNNPSDITRPAVPLQNIGLSGYGANTFSDWRNKNATFAATSQATFNVTTGRTMKEVVQVKSVIYPWGIFVVRTITILRLSNGYVIRLDSGWQAVNDGKFYFGINNKPNPYDIHAGLVRGLYNIKNIRENSLTFKDSITINVGDIIFDPVTNTEIPYEGPGSYNEDVLLRGVTFDADIDIESVIEGQNPITKRVPSKGVLGFVQLAPRGFAISAENLYNLLDFQNGSIGGPVNCTLKIADTEQYMKINRVDVNNSKDISNKPIFVAAARGSVVLPKEGSWTMVTHKASDGTVTPLDTNMSVPLIRIGKWDLGKLENPADLQNLQRIAHPIELLREASAETINFGFLQNLDTQKLLFLTPSFKIGVDSLLSKTPPLMADGYRLLNSKGIFPNVGNAIDNLGDAVKLLKAAGGVDDIFSKVAGVTDGAKDVYKLLEIASKVDAGKLVDQGYEILKSGIDGQINKALNFDFPAGDYALINNENFKIIIKYKAGNDSKLDYNLDSFANDLEDQWRGRLNNISVVVTLGPFVDLMTVMGNSNNEKGKESNFGGKISAGADTLPTPKIVFSDAVEPVIQILEILEDISGGDYADAFNKGLKVAMSNSANVWEYKYEATKEIGLIRFPPAPAYEAPQTPLKLEASLSLGFSFNAALKVTTNPKDLLPTAGAFFQFHGGIQVMCVSVAAATIYAIGNVDLKLAADTSPILGVDMKFGFGAQLSVGLPVIGTVSIQFMISVEIHADTGNNVSVAAMMMFRGHAEILGGIVGVTITIEAKGAIEKSGDGPTNCRASVSFGLDISVAFIINISFHESWEETKQIA